MQILSPSCHYTTTNVCVVKAMVFPVVVYGRDSMDMSVSMLPELVVDREVLRAVVHGVAESHVTERLD